MRKVEYIVGSFLAETEIATHIIPERTVDPVITEEKIRNRKYAQARIRRKTENTTRKVTKPNED